MRAFPTDRDRLLRMIRRTRRAIVRSRLLLVQTRTLVERSQARLQAKVIVAERFADQLGAHDPTSTLLTCRTNLTGRD